MPVEELTLPQRDSKRSRQTTVPPPIVISRKDDGQLIMTRGDVKTPIKVCRCFPWSEPRQFVSLRDDKEQEVALIKDVSELDEASRAVMEVALAEAGFVLEVERIHSTEEVYEVRHWQVQTRQGARTFQTKLDEWPREVPGGGYLVRDISGDLFHIVAPEMMDEKSQKLLWALVD